MKKLVILGIVALLLAVALPSAALAWQEGPSTDWYYLDAQYEGWKDDGTLGLVIELNGNPAAGQVFAVGDTISISGWLHAYAGSCAGTGNGAYTEGELSVSGPSGPGSLIDWDYDQQNEDCAEAETINTLTISYTLTAPGTHTVEMTSYAAVSQYWEDVAEESLYASLTFKVVPMAGGPKGAGKAPLYDSGGYTCPGGASETDGPTFGFVVLNTNANGDLIIQVSLKGATPGATYDIWVNQDPGSCPLGVPTAPGALTTNVKGNGNAHVEVARVDGATNFWVSAVGGGQVLRSTAVVLD